MKLFTKYNRVNLWSTIIIFLLGCASFTILLRYVILSQIDEDLRIEKNEVVSYINKFSRLPSVIEVRDQYTIYKLVPFTEKKKDEVLTHSVFNKYEHESELVRTIEFDVIVTNSRYRVSVSKSLEGTDDLIQTIILITVILILLILSASFIVNRIVLKKLWQPFYDSIGKMRLFKLNDQQKFNVIDTKIEEFNYLNSTLHDTLSKAQNDYRILKEFTENASHELQTPLAIIRSKLDVLIQDEHLTQHQSDAIKSAFEAVQGLSRMNQSLLLLAKIENRQFTDITTIDVKHLLEQKLEQFEELWKEASIDLDFQCSDSSMKGNIYLVNILLNNLLSNATKHNIANGFITIKLSKTSFSITNSGIETSLNKEHLFKRFSSQDNSETHHGLGLSINKQICDVSDYTYDYNFSYPNAHTFIITWS